MTYQRTAVPYFLLPLIWLCGAFLVSCGDTNEQENRSSSDSMPPTSEQPLGLADSLSSAQEDYEVIFDTIAEKNASHHYEVSAIYPQLRGLKNPEIEGRFNAGVRDSVTAMVRDFTSFLQQEGGTEGGGQMEGMEDPEASSSFELRSVIHTKNGRGLSIELSTYTYSAGAAHPNSATVSINYDLSTGRFLSLGDLFLPDAEYLKMISDYCIKDLMKRQVSDEEWVKRGAEQMAENYRIFFVTSDALVIQFDPYQVAPYAAGPQIVEIPWSQMKGMLDPKGIAGK